jgi:RHS repeat-associated protein
MKKITRNSGSSKADLEFGYDASGNRLWKKVTPKGSGAVISTYYYLRDAQGNEMCRYVKYTNTSSQLMYVAQEHSIYGSSRVGVDNRKDTLYMGAVYTPTWGGVGTSRRALGLKSFELANHLGNVLVTVSDKPIYKVSSTTIFFQPEITSSSDYYPFGAPIAGRGYSSEAYRFGFNGKEVDGEVNGEGNSIDFGARMLDTRLGRWLSVDPMKKGFPFESPFIFVSNNSLVYNDPTGKTRIVTIIISDESTGKITTLQVVGANELKRGEKWHDGGDYYNNAWYDINDTYEVNVNQDGNARMSFVSSFGILRYEESPILRFIGMGKSDDEVNDKLNELPSRNSNSNNNISRNWGGVYWTTSQRIGGDEETKLGSVDVKSDNIDFFISALNVANTAASTTRATNVVELFKTISNGVDIYEAVKSAMENIVVENIQLECCNGEYCSVQDKSYEHVSSVCDKQYADIALANAKEKIEHKNIENTHEKK